MQQTHDYPKKIAVCIQEGPPEPRASPARDVIILSAPSSTALLAEIVSALTED